MKYVDSPYRLRPLTADLYSLQSKRFAFLQRKLSLEGALRAVTKGDEPELTDMIIGNAENIHSSYCYGGGFYAFAFGVGLKALREVNPRSSIPGIEPEDWDSAMAREKELNTRPNIRTLEELGGIGLLEVREVNPGYVDGYQRKSGVPNLSHWLGFTGLGTLHAHDLIHFASQRAD